MGKLILCSGVRTTRPYGFAATGDRVYSMEELCFYLFHHTYLIDDELLNDHLIDWIGYELKLGERAEKLRQLKHQKVDLKTLVTVILCSADYYTEAEIKGMLKKLDEMIGMPKLKRSCIKADSCLEQKQYREAVAEYERLLQGEEATELTPEDYGDLLHHLAVAKLHTTGFKEAALLFGQAYERNHREESLRQYLYALRIGGYDTLYRDKLEQYGVQDELAQDIEAFLMEKQEEAENSVNAEAIRELRRYKSKGLMTEYYQRLDELLYAWKAELRQI